jgi:hypothetical protein
LSWLAYRELPISDAPCAGEGEGEGEGETEPPVVCIPQPVDEASSRAKWSSLDVAEHFDCAGCHANLGTPEGAGQLWGPGGGDWWTAASALVERQAALPTESHSLYLHFTTNFSRFHEDGVAAERDDTLEWLTHHLSGPLPDGCE